MIGVAYALRAIGDVGNAALSWLSPIGWYQAMHPFSGLRWWPAAAARSRPRGCGRRRASPVRPSRLRRRPVRRAAGPGAAGRAAQPLGLAWRLQRGCVLGWAAGLFLPGLAYGSIGDDVEDLIGDSDLSQDVFVQGGGTLVDALLRRRRADAGPDGGRLRGLVGAAAAGEEDAGRVEGLLATGADPLAVAAAHVAVTVAGTAVVVGAPGSVSASATRW